MKKNVYSIGHLEMIPYPIAIGNPNIVDAKFKDCLNISLLSNF